MVCFRMDRLRRLSRALVCAVTSGGAHLVGVLEELARAREIVTRGIAYHVVPAACATPSTNC